MRPIGVDYGEQRVILIMRDPTEGDPLSIWRPVRLMFVASDPIDLAPIATVRIGDIEVDADAAVPRHVRDAPPLQLLDERCWRGLGGITYG